jgi:hypothetical protein
LFTMKWSKTIRVKRPGFPMFGRCSQNDISIGEFFRN